MSQSLKSTSSAECQPSAYLSRSPWSGHTNTIWACHLVPLFLLSHFGKQTFSKGCLYIPHQPCQPQLQTEFIVRSCLLGSSPPHFLASVDSPHQGLCVRHGFASFCCSWSHHHEARATLPPCVRSRQGETSPCPRMMSCMIYAYSCTSFNFTNLFLAC